MMPAGSINAWQCEDCGLYTVAVHKHRGTTPMFLGCRAMAGCEGRAISLGYPNQSDVPEWVMAELKWEWYMPTRAEIDELEPHMKEHVIRGGLLLRELTKDNEKTREVPPQDALLDPF